MSLSRPASFSPAQSSTQWTRTFRGNSKTQLGITKLATRLRSKADIAESPTQSLDLEVDLTEDSVDYVGQGFSTSEIENLMEVLCEATTVSEVKLKLDGSSLSMKRKGGYVAAPSVAPAAAPVADPPPSLVSAGGSMDESGMDAESSMDEGLIYVVSPKVGLLRNALYNKAGRKVGSGPKVGTAVKKGQPLCSIEQLGTYVPVLAPQPGEIVGFEIEDGAPVEYNQEVLEFSPYFGGHIIGDSKYS